jgi:hypothetical protein
MVEGIKFWEEKRNLSDRAAYKEAVNFMMKPVRPRQRF